MTDWQQPLIVALTQAQGVSIVHETVYENRFGFTEALIDMGADIVVHKEGIASVTRRVPRRAARAGRRHHRPDAAARRRRRDPRPARRLQPPHRRPHRGWHVDREQRRASSAAATSTSSTSSTRPRRGLRRTRADRVARTTVKPARRPPLWRFLAGIVVPLLNILGRYEIVGSGRIPKTGAFILAPNHYTNIDPLVVGLRAVALRAGAAVPREGAASSRCPCSVRSLRATGQIPVERAGRAARGRPAERGIAGSSTTDSR